MRLTPGRLPIAYQEVEYIQSSGTQYINTGVYGGSDVTTELVISDQSASTEAVPLGAQGSAYYDKSYYWWTSTLYNRVSCRSNYNENRVNNAFSSGAYKITSGSKTNTIISLPVGTYVPVTGAFNITETYRTDYTMFLFAMNDHGSPSNNCVCKIYSCKVWYDDGDTLVLDLVPCYRISDGEIGMYDLVSDTFLTNLGNGTFTKGKDVGVVTAWSIDVNGVSKSVKKVVDSNGDEIWNVLPNIYQEVEYIESTGHTQCIDTGVNDNIRDTLRIEIDQQINNVTQVSYAAQGVGNWGGYYGYYLMIPGSVHTATLRFGSGQYAEAFADVTNDHQRHMYIIDCTEEKVYVDSTEYTFVKDNAGGYFGNIFLFGLGKNNAMQVGVDMKIYSCKIYDGSNMLRWFIPCYRKQDTTIGLYDAVNGEFYTNAGSGTFTKGNDV